MLQSYEKSREKKKKRKLFCSFPSESNFGKANVTKKNGISVKKRSC
jgi:hypothetical protein